MRKEILWLTGIVFFCQFGLVSAQGFGTLAIPGAALTPHLHFRMGGDLLTFENSQNHWEQASNIRLKFGFANYIETGLNIYNAQITREGVGYSLAVQPLHDKGYIPDMLFGVRLVSDKDKYVTGLGIPIDSKSTYTVYTSLGKTIRINSQFPTRLTIGIGNGYFKSDSGGRAEDLHGFFAGISQNLGVVNLSYEFDGWSNYLGMWFQPLAEIILKLGIRDIDKLSRQGDTFRDVGSLLLGITYQAPLVPQFELDKARKDNAQLRYQVQECFNQLEYVDVSMERRTQQISELKERIEQESQQEGVKFKQYMQAEAEVYRLKERIAELGKQKSIDYSKLNQSIELLDNAFINYTEGKYELAKKACLRAVQLTPNLALAHTRLGSMYYLLGENDKALIAWRRSLQIQPNNEQIRKKVQELENR